MKRLSSLLLCSLAGFLVVVAQVSASATCILIHYQPVVPESLRK